MRARILLASALALTLLALTHPAWAWNNTSSCIAGNRPYYRSPEPSLSVIVMDASTVASLPDALDAFYAQPIEPGQLVVMWLGAGAPSGILLKNREKMVLIDPANMITGGAVQRLQRLDVLLITHEHYDHFSASAVISIQSQTGAVVVVNPGSFGPLSASLPSSKLVRMTSGNTRVLSGINITAIASIHPADQPLTYILTFSDFSAFHGSDSGFNPALSAYKGKAKLAMVPTGDGSPTASPGDALQMVKALEPSDVIPMHGTVAEYDALGVLLAKQAPGVQYLRLQATSSVVVSEFPGTGFLALLISVAGLYCGLVSKRRKLGNGRPTKAGVCSCGALVLLGTIMS
jgi:L-ascorbate metabolism protein UlaG (beta-lactamase superfamily)